MSLARAFTKRLKQPEFLPPTRSNQIRYAPGTIDRTLISLPTELLSTTNVQALTAPDIKSLASKPPVAIGNDFDFSTIDRSFLGSAGSRTPSESSPDTPITPVSDDIKDFFNSKPSVNALPFPVTSAIPAPPSIPKRAPSHSKQAHVELNRKRSMQRMSPPPTAIAKPILRSSNETSTSAIDLSHPFGRELAQVQKVAEEFGGSTALLDQEEQEMTRKGLCKFGVEDYLDEIADLYGGVFDDQLGPLSKPWV